MELRNIVTFLQAAEMENFTHAANSLGYSQSTVTVQIKQLETELGYQLFDRVGNRISLTPRGEEFRYYANQLVSISQQIKLIPMREPENLHGTLRIGILESLFFHILLPLLHRERSRFPLHWKKDLFLLRSSARRQIRRQQPDEIRKLLQKSV